MLFKTIQTLIDDLLTNVTTPTVFLYMFLCLVQHRVILPPFIASIIVTSYTTKAFYFQSIFFLKFYHWEYLCTNLIIFDSSIYSSYRPLTWINISLLCPIISVSYLSMKCLEAAYITTFRTPLFYSSCPLFLKRGGELTMRRVSQSSLWL